MNYKTTLVLIVLLSVVGGYFYLVEYGNISGYEAHELQRKDETTQTVGQPVFTENAPTADSIDRIQIKRGGREVMLGKQGDQWLQTQPVRFALESYVPDAIARQFAELRYIQQMEPDTPDAPTTAQMGLDKPRAVVTVWVGDDSWTLKLGRQAVDGHGYMQVEGDETAYVVDPALHGTVLDQQINDWRSKSLDIPTASALERIGLHQDGAEIDLTKTDGRWRIDGQGVQRASDEAINDLLTAAGSLWITAFTADNPDSLALYGLDKPHLELVIQSPPPLSPTGEEAEQTQPVTRRLKIGRTDLQGNARYATWSQDDEPTIVVFTVDTSSADSLVRAPDELRDRRVVVAIPQDVRDLVVQQGGSTTLHLIRDPQSGYRFGDPQPGFDVDYSTAHALIQQLCGLEATAYNTELDGLGDPIAQVQLGVAAGNGEVDFNIYRTRGSHTIVNQGEGVGYVVETESDGYEPKPMDLFDRLLGTPLGLRKRTILDVSRDEITHLTLRRPDGVTYEFAPSDAESGWSLTGHEQFEDATFAALLDSLGPLRVEEWVHGYGLRKTRVFELTLDITDQPQQTLTFQSDMRLSALSGNDMSFTLPKTFVDLLNAEYRDRTVLSVPIENITSVKLASGSSNITLSRDGQRFVGDQGEVDQALAAGVFDALSGLRTERYVNPLHMRPEDIDFTVELTTTDGESRILRLVNSEKDTVTVTMDPHGDRDYAGWFTLERDMVDRLRAPLTEVETPTK